MLQLTEVRLPSWIYYLISPIISPSECRDVCLEIGSLGVKNQRENVYKNNFGNIENTEP